MSMPGYNLARFDFVSIRLAVLCAQTGSLTTAARQCNLVLPAASRRLKELEAATGSLLFERHSRGLSITPAGRIFMRRGLALLQEMDGLVSELVDLNQGIARHLRLFAGTAAINQFLPPLMAEYTHLHPEVQTWACLWKVLKPRAWTSKIFAVTSWCSSCPSAMLWRASRPWPLPMRSMSLGSA